MSSLPSAGKPVRRSRRQTAVSVAHIDDRDGREPPIDRVRHVRWLLGPVLLYPAELVETIVEQLRAGVEVSSCTEIEPEEREHVEALLVGRYRDVPLC